MRLIRIFFDEIERYQIPHIHPEFEVKIVQWNSLMFGAAKPDGMPPKLIMDVSRLKALDWQMRIRLEDDLRETYAWFLANLDCYQQA
ncbi:MAG: hypothetical protein ACXV8Q_02835 [Methylobacter sp.]